MRGQVQDGLPFVATSSVIYFANATFPSRGDSPQCGVSPRKKYACGIFQGEWDKRRRRSTEKMASEAAKRAGRLSEVSALRQTPIYPVMKKKGRPAPALQAGLLHYILSDQTKKDFRA